MLKSFASVKSNKNTTLYRFNEYITWQRGSLWRSIVQSTD